MGEDRLVLILEAQAKHTPQLAAAYVAPLGEQMNAAALVLAKELRATGLRIELGRWVVSPEEIVRGGQQGGGKYRDYGRRRSRLGYFDGRACATRLVTVQGPRNLSAKSSPQLQIRTSALLDFLGTLQRTHTCGELRAQQAGDQVILMGWVNRRRDHGNLIFLDLRDRTGITQICPGQGSDTRGSRQSRAGAPAEYVVAVVGKVRLRGPEVINPKMATGEIEVAADQLLVLNDSRVAPFSPAEDAIANEELRLKYRYIDLRRQQMQQNFELRPQDHPGGAGEPLQPGFSGD